MPMIELPAPRFLASRVPAHLNALFDVADPLSVRALGVLQGTRHGRVWVDDIEQPSCAVLQEAAEGCTYLGGQPSATWVAAAIAQLRQHQAVLIGLWPNDPRWSLLPTHADLLGNSLDFEPRNLNQNLEALLHVPEDCQLRQINMDLAQHSPGFVDWCKAFGGVETYLAHGLSYGLWQGNTLISQASADPPANGVMEIGTETQPNQRGRGYATRVCAQIVLACEQRGYRVHWNCNALNAPSAAIAHKLGYTQSRAFPWRYWEKESSS